MLQHDLIEQMHAWSVLPGDGNLDVGGVLRGIRVSGELAADTGSHNENAKQGVFHCEVWH
jgi:hypothetical protein